jgi:hypothetical protein
MARRASPNAIPYPRMFDSGLSKKISDQYLLDLTNNRPTLIVDMDYTKSLSLDPQKRAAQLAAHQGWPYLPANINQVFEFINENYHVEITFRNATVYRLNGTSGP